MFVAIASKSNIFQNEVRPNLQNILIVSFSLDLLFECRLEFLVSIKHAFVGKEFNDFL